MLRPRPKL